MIDTADEDSGRRAARRAYIRARHPDRGGDPAQFVAGLASFDVAPPSEQPPKVVIHNRASLRARVLRRLKRAPAAAPRVR